MALKSWLPSCLRLLGAGVAGRATTRSFFPKLTNPLNVLQVETLHDFEAANSDELNLQRGDVVLVVPSDSEADQVMCKTGRCVSHIGLLRASWTSGFLHHPCF